MFRRVGLALLAALTACTTTPTPAVAAPVPYFYLDNAATNEDSGCMPIVAHRIGSNGKSSTLRVTLRSGTAKAGEDFTGTTYDFTFASNVSAVSRCADLMDDQLKEATENFSAIMRPVKNAKLYDDGAAFFQLADSDSALNASPPPLPPPVVEPTPVLTQTCPDGSIIPTTNTCPQVEPEPDEPPPPTTKTCWDGSVIPVANSCPAVPPTPPATQTCWDGSVILASLQCPVEPPPPPPPPPPPDPDPPLPPPDLPAGGLTGLAPIPSEFDAMALTTTVAVPKSAAPDQVGAFRFVCKPGQLLRDDPIVKPGQPGASHLHQFFGNLSANGNSTNESLRTTGESSCVNKSNRSGYWMPALQDNTHVYKPDHVQIYYKRRPASDPKCKGYANAGEGTCIPLPRGLRFVFGYDMITATAPTGAIYFRCTSGTVVSPNSAHQPDIASAMGYCPEGARFSVTIVAPACWNGLHLDSVNHRNHVSYHVRNPNTGVNACPVTHPYVVPQFTLTSIWPVTPELKAAATAGTLRFSSDDQVPTAPHGTTFHSDWWGAWDDVVKQAWEVDGCIDKLLNCADGDLGIGKKMKNTLSTTQFPSGTIRVPIP